MEIAQLHRHDRPDHRRPRDAAVRDQRRAQPHCGRARGRQPLARGNTRVVDDVASAAIQFSRAAGRRVTGAAMVACVGWADPCQRVVGPNARGARDDGARCAAGRALRLSVAGHLAARRRGRR